MARYKLNVFTGNFDEVGTGSGGGGTGNVNGPTPGVSTDNAVVRWDGTSGRLIQNSTAILDDNGELHLLAVLQQDTIPPLVTLQFVDGEVYIIGEDLNIEGTLDMGGTLILL